MSHQSSVIKDQSSIISQHAARNTNTQISVISHQSTVTHARTYVPQAVAGQGDGRVKDPQEGYARPLGGSALD